MAPAADGLPSNGIFDLRESAAAPIRFSSYSSARRVIRWCSFAAGVIVKYKLTVFKKVYVFSFIRRCEYMGEFVLVDLHF